MSIYSEQLKLVQIRRAAGRESNLDVVETLAKVDSARADAEAARRAYGEIRRALEVLLGRYPGAELEAAVAYPSLPPPSGTGTPASLLERRTDIVVAERQVLEAFRLEESAKLALLPDFLISLAGGRLGDQVLSLLRLNPWLATASIGVSVPIYEGGALRGIQRLNRIALYLAVGGIFEAEPRTFEVEKRG